MGADQSCQLRNVESRDKVFFFINGEEFHVNPSQDGIDASFRLVDFIRDKAGFKGTKYMCRQGGCGACIVTVKSSDPNSGSDVVMAVNSCLTPVLACDGWEITTIEGLGSVKSKLHILQEKMVEFSGTQCGFCTPGMIMSMNSLMESNPGFSVSDVEATLDGNMCRCTGYRPILDAFKSLATDAGEELKNKFRNLSKDCHGCSTPSCPSFNQDIEDLQICHDDKKIILRLDSDEDWITARSLNDVYAAMTELTERGIQYRFVAGNTSIGLPFSFGPSMAYIDISSVPELKYSMVTSDRVEIGATVTLTRAIVIFEMASKSSGFKYLGDMARHLKRVASTSVRNTATVGGNLAVKNQQPVFPSDIFVMFEAAKAKVVVGMSASTKREYALTELQTTILKGKLIHAVTFRPHRGDNFYYRSFKIAPRYQSSLAYAVAGFLFTVDKQRNFLVEEKPNIVFGGISPNFVHATATEDFLLGKHIDERTMKGAMDVMKTEVQPTEGIEFGSTEYIRALTQALLYKALLGIRGDLADPFVKSAALDLKHNLTSGKQTYWTDPKEWPLYKPIPKLEAAVQTTGEAQYVKDIPPEFGELQGVFVLSSEASADIERIDASQALMVPGVKAFITAKDIPGANNYSVMFGSPEPIFAEKSVVYNGQPIGLILAQNIGTAFRAAGLVKVTYTNIKPPVLEIQEEQKEEKLQSTATLDVRGNRIIKGKYHVGNQYHMHMETQIAICVPKEDGLEVYSATQNPNDVHVGLSSALKMDMKNITITVRRLGGGYGGKLFKAALVACAAAVGAHTTKKPVRVFLDLESNMRMIGKRHRYLLQYEGTVADTGELLSLKGSITCDTGAVPNETYERWTAMSMQSCYSARNWDLHLLHQVTNKPSNTSCRAPATAEGTSMIEYVLDHVARCVNMDPLAVRMVNLMQEGDPLFLENGSVFEGKNPIKEMIEELKVSAEYDARKDFLDKCNRENRYRKKGLSLVPMRWGVANRITHLKYPVFLSVYALDGTVTVSHAGIEMGQGINTKVAQVVAKFLRIPLSKIRVTPMNTVISPNVDRTSGSVSSETVCKGAIKACDILLKKMEPVRMKLKNPSWDELVTKCYNEGILLTAQDQPLLSDVPKTYDVWAVCLTEVEIDVLTGEYKISRVDLLQDAGYSISPEVDIGQIEGSFIHGLGLHLTEKIVYDKNGQLLSNNVWTYKVPFSKDIPEDFRITMMKNRPNPVGILASKATGEPSVCLGISVNLALRNAIDSARRDAGNQDWYQLDSPVTPEDIQKACLNNPNDFKL